MVIVDNRDGSEALVRCKALRDRAVLGRLEFGDVLLTGHGPNDSVLRVGVEVKTVMDLLSSIATGRLAGHQLPGMFNEYDVSWLLVHGAVRRDEANYLQVRRKSGWRHYRIGGRQAPWSYLEGWLLTATMTSPLKVKWVSHLEEAAAWIAVLDGWLSKEWSRHKALKVFNRAGTTAPIPGTNPVTDQIARTAATLPAIGWDRAQKIAQKFDSVDSMIKAPEHEWREIDGIGPVIARSVYEAIRRSKD